jgi:hypothetical protein
MTMDSHHTVFLTPNDARALEFAARYVLELNDPAMFEAASAAQVSREMLQTAYAALRAQTTIMLEPRRRK